MPTIAAGASSTISLPAGRTFSYTGAGSSGSVLVFGPGPAAGQPYALMSSGVLGPFGKDRTLYVSAAQAITYSTDGPVGEDGLTAAQQAAGATGVAGVTAEGALVGPGGSLVSGGGVLLPNGNDQSSEIFQFINDNMAAGKSGKLGPGDFILGSTVHVYPVGRTESRWSNPAHGVGGGFFGCGAGVTKLNWVGPDASYALMLDPGDTYGRRTYLSKYGQFSLLSKTTGGADLAVGTTRGLGIAIRTPDGVGFTVHHTNKWEQIIFGGFDYPMSVNDTTLLKMSQCWFTEALVGLRIGANVDMTMLEMCMFGSEDYPAHRTWTGIQNGWTADGFASPGNTDNLVLNQVWARNIGTVVDFSQSSSGENNIKFQDTYFERCDQHLKVGTGQIFLTIDGHNVTGANFSTATTGIFEIKSSGGTVNVKGMHGEAANPPTKTWFYFKTSGVKTHWEGNDLPATADASPINGVAGHMVHNDETGSGVQQSRLLPNRGRGVYDFGGNDPAPTAISKSGGNDIYKNLGTLATGNLTVTLDTRIADFFECTLPVNGSPSVVTFALPAGGANGPFPCSGQRLKLIVQASSASMTNTTIAFTGFLNAPGTIVQQTVASLRTVFEWECVSSGRWLPVINANAWV